MPTLITRYNFGQRLANNNPELFRQLSDLYSDIASIMNTKASKLIISGANPPANSQVNKNYDIGDLAVRTDTNTAWIMTSRTTDEIVVWTQIT